MKIQLLINDVIFPFIFVEGNESILSFWIGETPVTQLQYEAIIGNNPSQFRGEFNPVEMVSWIDCKIFIDNLRELGSQKFNLSTKIQWKFAAKGGNQSQDFQYAGSNNLDEVSWHRDNSDRTTHPVKLKKPNELGIYDMLGNVWEWCETEYGLTNTYIILGNSWNSPASHFQRVDDCYYNHSHTPNFRHSIIGFRVVINP